MEQTTPAGSTHAQPPTDQYLSQLQYSALIPLLKQWYQRRVLQHRVVLDDGDRAGGDGRELHAAREVALAPRLLGRRGSGRAGRGGKETLVSITRRAASVARMVYGVPRVMGEKRKQWGKRRRERENEVGGGTPDWLCMRLPREDSPPSSTTAKNTNPSLAPSRHTHFCIYMCRTLSRRRRRRRRRTRRSRRRRRRRRNRYRIGIYPDKSLTVDGDRGDQVWKISFQTCFWMTSAAATQPSPRVSRPARTGEPTYRTTRSRDRSGSRSGSRERKPPSEREAQTTKGRPWRDTPSCATPPRPVRRSASKIGGGLVDRAALRSAIAIRPSGLHGAKKKT